MLNIYIVLMLGFLLLVLQTKRITEKPFRVKLGATESAANIFTEVAIQMPTAVIGDRVQALEVMRIKLTASTGPDLEDSQDNLLAYQWTRDTQSAILSHDDDQVIDSDTMEVDSEFTTSGGSAAVFNTLTVDRDMTDHDGNGEIVVDRTTHFAVKGTGNAAVKSFRGYALCHLVEIDAADLAVRAFVEDS